MMSPWAFGGEPWRNTRRIVSESNRWRPAEVRFSVERLISFWISILLLSQWPFWANFFLDFFFEVNFYFVEFNFTLGNSSCCIEEGIKKEVKKSMSLATLFDFFFLTLKKKSKKKLAQNRHWVTNKIEIQKVIDFTTEKLTSGPSKFAFFKVYFKSVLRSKLLPIPPNIKIMLKPFAWIAPPFLGYQKSCKMMEVLGGLHTH